ncbi:hypothetical protein RJT34_08787 [Clitoria ternatea]|uniref:Uncharacterized protein n=1 Tax=Clitoria ternatea TaxID=43366 RepID=A0AAN9K6N6_CLITE
MKEAWCSKEHEVAEILVNLNSVILELDFEGVILPPWGRRKKRSAVNVIPNLKQQASSPATPLSFSPSESDHDTLPRRNLSLKRKKEHYVKILEELTKDNNLLHGEIRNVTSYLEKVRELNMKMKARKLELSVGPNRSDPRRQLQFSGVGPVGIPDLNLPVEEESCEGLAMSKLLAAQARQNRLLIYRLKISKSRYSCT